MHVAWPFCMGVLLVVFAHVLSANILFSLVSFHVCVCKKRRDVSCCVVVFLGQSCRVVVLLAAIGDFFFETKQQ